MVMDLLKKAKRRGQFGLAKINPVVGYNKFIDEQKLKGANKDTTSAINKTGQAFAYRELGPGYERGYDDRVKRRQQSELKRTGKIIQGVSERNRKRLERLNNIR